MTGTEWMVLIGGVALIALVNWYFFFAVRPASPDGAAKGP